MLKSRGDGRSTSTSTPSAIANRAPDQISSLSYSFNQLHPILPPSGANPPRTPPHSTPSTYQPSLSTNVPKDAHFPKLPSAPSLLPRSYLNSSSQPPATTKWATKNRRLVTAAQVVASAPPDTNGPSAEEEAAAKELDNFAMLVPVVSAIPRNPGRTVSHGGLRATGSLAALQRSRNAGSKVKHNPNALIPTSSLLNKDSSSRLQSLTSQSKLHSARKPVSNSASVSNSDLSSISARGKTSTDFDGNQVKLGERKMNALTGYRNAIVSNSTSKGNPEEILTGMANISLAKDSAKPVKLQSRSSVKRTQGIHVDASAPEEIEPASAEHRSLNLSEMFSRRAGSSTLKNASELVPKNTSVSFRNSGYSTSRSTQDVRISRDAPLSPKLLKSDPRVSEKEVLELRRQAFAPSTDSRSLRPRNSAYQSTRRRNQPPANVSSNVANVGPELGRSTASFQSSFDHRIPTNGRSRPLPFEHVRAFSSTEENCYKSPPLLDSHSGLTSVAPKNTRADSIRSTHNLSDKKTLNWKGANAATEANYANADPKWTNAGECENDRKTAGGIGLLFGENRGVAHPVPAEHTSEPSNHVNSSEQQPQGMGFSNYPYAWPQFDTNFSLKPPGYEVPTAKLRETRPDGPSCRVLKGYHEESHIATNSSRVIGKDRSCGRFAKSPIFCGIGNGSDAWIPTVDGPRNEEISKIFLAAEAKAAELRGSSRCKEGRRDVCDAVGSDGKGETAIETMIRLQSNARLRMPDARAAHSSNASVSGRSAVGPNPSDDFELPPLPGPHDAQFDSLLKNMGGYPADEEVACDGPAHLQNRHFNS